MSKPYSRKLKELDALYRLEPILNDIFVEGPEDSNLIEYFLFHHDLLNVQVYSVDVIDFGEAGATMDDLDGNKKRVLYLAHYLGKLIEEKDLRLTFIVDRDFDTIDENYDSLPTVIYTDFANLEMYLLNEPSLRKFSTLVLKKFPLKADEIIAQITPLLVDVFALRYARLKLNNSWHLPALDKVFKINSQVVVYNREKLVQSFVDKNKCTQSTAEIEEYFAVIESKLTQLKDTRFFVHGKDYFEILFLLIRKVRNVHNFKFKTFERAFIGSIEVGGLTSYELFLKLKNKYKSVRA